MSSAYLQPHHLQRHPASEAGDIDSLQVEISLQPSGEIRLTYVLDGNLASLRVPDAQPAGRADGLWRHTCFEAFIRVAGDATYREFNFSPSGQWQAYTFTDYRAGGLLEPAADPAIQCWHEANLLTLQATLQPVDLPTGAHLQIGLSAVIETRDGAISYWALNHAPGKPDFHHPDTFALDINLS
jgi:hypothetical protein